MSTPSRPAGRVDHAGAPAGDGVAGHGRHVGQAGEERAGRDVLAERHPVDLVVAVDDPARRDRRRRPRCGTGRRRCPPPRRPRAWCATRRPGRPAPRSSGEPASTPGTSTTSSGHRTRSTPAADRGAGPQVGLEDRPRVAADRPQAPRPATLHRGHRQLAVRPSVGRHRARRPPPPRTRPPHARPAGPAPAAAGRRSPSAGCAAVATARQAGRRPGRPGRRSAAVRRGGPPGRGGRPPGPARCRPGAVRRRATPPGPPRPPPGRRGRRPVGRPARPAGRTGARASAPARMAASSSTVTTKPGRLKSRIHHRPGR